MNPTNYDIRRIRTADVTVTLAKEDGTLLTGEEVVVAQKRHHFLFGGAGFFTLPLANAELQGVHKEALEQRQAKFFDLFNTVTLPFYWGRFEPQRGKPDTERLRRAAQWCIERGCRVKGHPLCWHTATADWLLPLSSDEILKVQLNRIQREVTDFKGLIDIWDVINEAVIMPVFDKYDNGITRICKELGRTQTILRMFAAARAANPEALLLINDFDVSSAYDILVEGCLNAGIRFDVIGIQSHMHQGYWGIEKTQWVLENFTRFKLPIHFTENTLVSGQIMPPEIVDLNDYRVSEWPTTPEGEERQAREVIQHYETLLANPLVESITWWDFADGGWLGAPAGLVRRDNSSKPAYDELLKRVKGEWWLPPTHLVTDSDGRIRFSGFLGSYELTWAGKTVPFELKTRGAAEIKIKV